jgi:membrane dipeptidase
MSRPLWYAAGAVALAAVAFLTLAAPLAGLRLNRLDRRRPPPRPSSQALQLHHSLRIADLHDDVLLWDRDPLRRSWSGHSDLPRLQDGNVAVQIFSTVTWTPRGIRDLNNAAGSDDITLLAVASRWPARSWRNHLERALYQADKLRRAAADSGGRLAIVTSRAELAAALAGRDALPPGPRPVAGLLSVEGLHALDGRVEGLDALFAAGFRAAGLVHFFDNEVAGSAHGVGRGGLTPLGRQALRRMEELRMVVDLAHASPATLEEVLSLATRPVLVSHGGVQAVCPGPRNLGDAQLRRLAVKGALFGVGYWAKAVCDTSPRGVARSIRHAAQVMGIEHVALGSDWDGAVTVAFDASQLAELTQGLLDEGFSEPEIRAVMGENAIRFLLQALP